MALVVKLAGERCNEIAVGIAGGTGCSVRTVQNHLAENTALQWFVRKQVRFETDPCFPTGKRRQ